MKQAPTLKLIEFAAGAMLAALLLVGIAHVGLRLVSGGGLIWFADVARYGLVWMVMLGAAVAAFRGGHILIDTGLDTAFGPVMARILACLRFTASIVFLGTLVWLGSALTLRMWGQSFVTVRWLSLGWVYAALPVGAALMLLAALAGAVQSFTQSRRAGQRADR